MVARIDLDENTFITDTETLLDVEKIPTDLYEERQDIYILETERTEIFGKVLSVPVQAGTRIERSFLAPPGLSQQMPTAEPGRPRPKGYPLEVDTYTGVADQVQIGDLVDVVATYDVERRVYTPPLPTPIPLPGEAPEPPKQGNLDIINLPSTKTIVQRAKVLNIVRPPPPTPTPLPEGAEPPPPAPPQQQQQQNQESGIKNKITQGQWQIVLAVSDQEAEVLEFSQKSGAKLTLVLRGVGDNVYEDTIGVTFDLVVSEFGLPLPGIDEPYIFNPELDAQSFVPTARPTLPPTPEPQPEQ